jgi:hypothetical protein
MAGAANTGLKMNQFDRNPDSPRRIPSNGEDAPEFPRTITNCSRRSGAGAVAEGEVMGLEPRLLWVIAPS